MCRLTPHQLSQIIYALTLSERSSSRERWLRRGFGLLGHARLLAYWTARIERDEVARDLSCRIWQDYRKAAALLQQPKPPKKTPGGVGTELKALLKTVGIIATPNCSCNKRAAIMDEMGIDWCVENRGQILDWLQEEAARRKLPFLRPAAALLLRRAIARARKLSPHLNQPTHP